MRATSAEGTKFASFFEDMVALPENMRQMYFLDVLSQPTPLDFASFSWSVVATKHPKNTFAACFPFLRSTTIEAPTYFLENIQEACPHIASTRGRIVLQVTRSNS